MIERAHLSPHVLAAWNAAAARVFTAVGAPMIGNALTAAMQVILDFDATFIAILQRQGPPVVLHMSGTAEPAFSYNEGPYLLDPFYNHFLRHGTDGAYLLSDLAPEAFFHGDYFSQYYRHIDIGDEIGLLVALSSDSCAHLSLTRRRGCIRFARRDCEWLSAAGPTVGHAIQRMSELLAPTTRDASAMHDSLTRAFNAFGSSMLTEREQQVAQLMLRGNSAKIVARTLEISPDTARNHSKRIYRKLDVTSQSELLALFFRALEQVEPGFEGDPLARLRSCG
jgi:DNA-binding CsgD family transcriptional regulator